MARFVQSEGSKAKQYCYKLNNGIFMPAVGLGTRKSEPGVVRHAVFEAIKCGYRHFDCAHIYGNEEEVGSAIREAIESGIVVREDLWLTSKLWNDYHAGTAVEGALRNSMRALGVEYLDLYLIHWPVSNVESEELIPPIRETWSAMERMVDMGLTRSIGVSNWSVSKLEAMKEYCRIFPAVNQVEAHVLFPQKELIQKCNEMGVHVTGYSTLGSPNCQPLLDSIGTTLFDHPVVVRLAKQVSRTSGQVLLKWALQCGVSIIPRSTNRKRIEENFNLDFDLSDAQMKELDFEGVHKFVRISSGSYWIKPQGPYKTSEDLWG